MEKKINKPTNFRQGFIDGLPVAIAYVPIAMAIAISAMNLGLGFSLTQLLGLLYTGSGQGIFLNLFQKGETLLLMYVFMLFVANFRYVIFAISMGQKMKPSTKGWQKFLYGIFNTDEIYVIAMQKQGLLGFNYLIGLATSAFTGYLAGSILGASAAGLIPKDLQMALGIMLSALFVAMLVPSAKKSKKFSLCVVIAAALSVILEWIPVVKGFIKGLLVDSWGFSSTGGITLLVCALLSAGVCAYFFPVSDENEEEELINE